ncbi:MAG TPA: hypothetical protein VF520_15880 [Thermoleophilaceae bacterium]|jgi:hypothetical protein
MNTTRTRLTIIAALAFAIAFAVPAAGVPSISSVSKTAKKALSQATSAKKTAREARSLAIDAAEVALAGPPVITRERKDIPAPPNDFARFDITCPDGYSAVGIGLGLGALEPVFFASYGRGALGSMFNPSSSSTFNGSVYVECVKTSGHQVEAASVPHMTKAEAQAEAAAAEAEARAAR